MKKDLEIFVNFREPERELSCKVSFSVFFGQEYGAWDYDFKINKITRNGQVIDFEFMDARYKATIENAIEEKLYFFPFHLFSGHVL